MYSDIMQRTQVYLSEEDVEALDRAVAQTGASRSELIRRAIRRQYTTQSAEERIESLERSFGAWRDRDDSGAEYVDAIRGDLNDRLPRLGLE
ncbi:MAG: ribbon-helix-helix domain-containing protein [Actinobacteria bacterium]|nr:ribbon-helix-helix domain-containing protein [Actinomycetota bacterium]